MGTGLLNKRKRNSVCQPFPLDGISLVRASEQPLHRQLFTQLRALMMRRTLRAGTSLPSSRVLAADLKVARNTVISAYQQLEAEGYLAVRPGAGFWVTEVVAEAPGTEAATPCDPLASLSRRGRLMVSQPRQVGFPGDVAFHPGTPDTRHFPFTTWQRLLVRNMRATRDDLLGYYSANGHPALRQAIVGYIEASRGVRCDPEQIVVTTGAQAALDLVARILLDPGDTVWMEEPGYLGAQSAFLAAGATLHPLRVDIDGWHVAGKAPSPPPRVVYLTPSCQFPLGLTMPTRQRLEMLGIAEAQGSWVIEDDFDCEYRFGVEPIPALYGTGATGRVIYIGTFAKTLFPSLRIGFMVLPGEIARRLKRALSITGQFAPLTLQATLADFIEEGHFVRHLHRARRLYATRRALFLRHCAEALGPWVSPVEGGTGIQATFLLGQSRNDVDIAARAREERIIVAALSTHYRHGAGQHGLVLGYAALDEEAMHRGFGVLRRILSTEHEVTFMPLDQIDPKA